MGVDISGIQNNNQDCRFDTTLNVVGSRITCRKDVELTEKRSKLSCVSSTDTDSRKPMEV